jgi:hypothetical protein
MCLGLWYQVKNNIRFNLLVSQPFLFIYVGKYIIVNVKITRQDSIYTYEKYNYYNIYPIN